MYFRWFKRDIVDILQTEENTFRVCFSGGGDFVFEFFFVEKKGLSALYLHEIFPLRRLCPLWGRIFGMQSCILTPNKRLIWAFSQNIPTTCNLTAGVSRVKKLWLRQMPEVPSENCYLQLSLIFHTFRVSVTILFCKLEDTASWICLHFYRWQVHDKWNKA